MAAELATAGGQEQTGFDLAWHLRHAAPMTQRPRTTVDSLTQRARKAGFVLTLVWRVALRGLATLVPKAKPNPIADDDALFEALQSRAPAALTGLAHATDAYGQPWLFHAIDIGSLAALNALLAEDAPLGPDKTGRTPLQAAIERSLAVDEFDDAPEDPLPMIAALIAHGADPNAPDARGLRPLHIAATLGAYEAARILQSLGADPGLPDAMGLTPAAYAR